MRFHSLTAAASAALIGLTGACGGRVQSAISGGAGGTGAGTGGAFAGAGGGCASDCGDQGVGGPSGGGACNLALIASGAPRQGPDESASQWVSVAALPSSFVVAAEKRSGASGDTWLYSFTDAGKVSTEDGISTRCMNGGATVAYDPESSSGMAAFAQDACAGEDAGVVVFPFHSALISGAPMALSDTGFTSLSLSSHALSPVAQNQFAFVFTATPGHEAKLGWLQDAHFVAGSTLEEPFNGTPADSVSVTSSDSILGVLAHLSAGGEWLQIGAPSEGAGGTVRSLGQAPWGAAAANGNRVATVMPAASGLDYQIFSEAGQIGTGHFGGPAFATGDVVALGNRWIVVGVDTKGRVMLYRIDDASGAPIHTGLVREFDTLIQGGAPADVALAAARDRVELVYSAPTGATGGWAQFECRN
jgi:hypothetical protein